MAYTATTFKERWQEFTPTADATVTAALAEATRRTDARVYGDRFDDAVGLLAAHNLSVTPFAQPTRLQGAAAPDDLDRTMYGASLKKLRRERGGGAWPVGFDPTGGYL